MTLGTAVGGSVFPEHTVSATMPAEATENKIHEDGVARTFGFRGALVPGVTLYAWMTHPVVAALGADWLERGTFAARFTKAVYFGEPATVRARLRSDGADSAAIETSVVDAAGVVCATATMTLAPCPGAPVPDIASYPGAPLPDERPRVSREVLAVTPVLGTPVLALDTDTASAFLERVRETLPLYSGPRARAHPGLYLQEANRALSRNVVVSPWVHVESEGRHLGALFVGERLETRGRVARLFERKGHQLVELDLLLLADGTRPVAHVRHVAIYQLRS